MKKFSQEMQKKISESEPEHLNVYIDMFDRLLLYSMAASSLPNEVINEMIEHWESAVKTTIDLESQRRTQFLESTPQGRLAKKQNQPDGEDIRLLFLTTLNTAKDIVSMNLKKPDEFETED